MDVFMKSTQARAGWVRNDNLRLRYVEWGRIDAPVLIMLHGLRSYAHTWEPVALRLAEHWRLIALDQRGRGESDWESEMALSSRVKHSFTEIGDGSIAWTHDAQGIASARLHATPEQMLVYGRSLRR